MLKHKNEIEKVTESNKNDIVKMYISCLAEFEEKNPKLRNFAFVSLNAGEEVEFHVHEGECEYYYILSGDAIYNDNGVETEVYPGTITFTPSGTGHGIRNVGKDSLEFMALILRD